MTTEVIGYRCWKIATRRTSDPTLVEVAGQLAIPYAIVLQSVTRDDPWPGPVMHADVKPTRHNSSGLYFLSTAEAARDYDRTAEVTGAASLYGHVVEHRDGFRAQHAALRSLTIHAYRINDLIQESVATQLVTLARVLERRYQCEVTIDTATGNMTPLEKLLRKIAAGELSSADLTAVAEKFGQ